MHYHKEYNINTIWARVYEFSFSVAPTLSMHHDLTPLVSVTLRPQGRDIVHVLYIRPLE